MSVRSLCPAHAQELGCELAYVCDACGCSAVPADRDTDTLPPPAGWLTTKPADWAEQEDEQGGYPLSDYCPDCSAAGRADGVPNAA